MGAEYIISTQGGQRIERALLGLADAFGDLTPLMEGIGLTLESGTIDRFDREEAPDGTKWTPSIRAREEGGKTLTDSSQLRSSVTSNASARRVEVGTNKIYAGAHQDGVNKNITVQAHSRTIDQAFGRRLPAPVTFQVATFDRMMKLVARPFLGMSMDEEAEILAQTEDYAVDAAGGAL